MTGGLVFLWAVGASVDIEATGATDAFTAVGCECEGFLASFDQTLVDVVKEFQDGHLRDSVVHINGLEVSFSGRTGLAPNLKMQFHYL